MAHPAPAARRRPPRVLFRTLNPLFALLLRSPLHALLSRRLLLLTFSGRQSGRRYTTPVGYAQVDDTLLLGTASRWKVHLCGGARVGVRLRGRARTGLAEVIDDEAGMTESYHTMLRVAPGYGRAIGVRLDADGRPNPAAVARVRREGHVVLRLRLGCGAATPHPRPGRAPAPNPGGARLGQQWPRRYQLATTAAGEAASLRASAAGASVRPGRRRHPPGCATGSPSTPPRRASRSPWATATYPSKRDDRPDSRIASILAWSA